MGERPWVHYLRLPLGAAWAEWPVALTTPSSLFEDTLASLGGVGIGMHLVCVCARDGGRFAALETNVPEGVVKTGHRFCKAMSGSKAMSGGSISSSVSHRRFARVRPRTL